MLLIRSYAAAEDDLKMGNGSVTVNANCYNDSS